VEEISRLEAMLTFLYKKVPAVRNRGSRPAFSGILLSREQNPVKPSQGAGFQKIP
jgi:hypothetical protein